MRLTRRQLRSLILREVKLLAEQSTEFEPAPDSEFPVAQIEKAQWDAEQAEKQAQQAKWDEMSDRWDGSRDQADEAFLWLVQAGELDGEFDSTGDIMGLDVTPDGALELAVWQDSQGRVDPGNPKDFRVVPVQRKGQPVMYAAVPK